MLNNPIRLMRDLDDTGGAGALLGQVAGGLTTGIGLVQTIGNIIGKAKSKDEINKLLAQRKAFVTPDEVYKLVNAATQKQGGDQEMVNLLTSQADSTFSQVLGTSALLGGSPNDFAKLFNQRVMTSTAIAEKNHAVSMANFSMLMDAWKTLAANKEAEWVSRDNLLKDRIQAAAGRGADANKGIGSGLNSMIAGLASLAQMGAWKDPNKSSETYISPVYNTYNPVTSGDKEAPSTITPRTR